MPEPLILAIETATLSGSIVLAEGARVIGALDGHPGVSHSNTLLRDLDKILTETETALTAVDLFAAASGPGSFTGLRIGIATVKALAATLGRPCAGIPTLHAIALAGGVANETVALLPAGRGEVFAQLFSVSADRVEPLDEAAHLSPEKLIEKYGSREQLLWCGEGATAQRELIGKFARGNQWLIAPPITTLARQVALLALADLKQSQTVAPDALRAIYVRPSDAELKM